MIRALLTAAVLVVMTAGCSGSSDNHDAGPGSGGRGGSGAGGAPAAVHCSPLSGTNCFCSTMAAGSLSACSPASVASTDHGYCCSGGGFCECYRTACVSLPTIGYCKCGDPIDDTSTRVDSCPQPAGGICCLNKGHVPYTCSCIESVSICLAGETQVASCSLADVMKCAATETAVALCK